MSQVATDINNVTIKGYVESELEPFNTKNGFEMLRFTLRVPRRSGASDHIPIIIPGDGDTCSPGDCVYLTGSLRSRNKTNGGKHHTTISVFSRDLTILDPKEEQDDCLNEIILSGTICNDPHMRVTPKGSRITNLIIACQRKTATGQIDYLPCITWNGVASQVEQCCRGDRISFKGRVQSRVYNKTLENGTVEERTAYEVSVLQLI